MSDAMREQGLAPRARVLFLTHAFPRFAGDPVGSFVLRLAVALRAHGVVVDVLAPAGAGAPASDVIEDIAVQRYRYAPRAWETLAYTGTMSDQVRGSWSGRVAIGGLLAASYRAASRHLRRRRYDLVHAHWWFPSGFVGSWLHRRRGIPLVTTMHGSDVRLIASVPGGRRLFASVARASAAMTTVSSWLAREASAASDAARPIVAPMPVLGELFTPGAERIPGRLLFIGKLTAQKGLQHLLRALATMKQRATLDVVGAGRVDDEAFRQLAADLGVADRVRWLPLLTQVELASLYRQSAVHVIPASGEGLGLTAVESLLCETPVVAFASGGVTDVVVNERTGLLVPPGDHVALASALDRMLESDALRARLGEDGRDFALSHFGPAPVAARYAGIYADVLAHRVDAGEAISFSHDS